MAMAGCFGDLSGVAACFHWMPRDSLGRRVLLPVVTEIVTLQVWAITVVGALVAAFYSDSLWASEKSTATLASLKVLLRALGLGQL